ncbi:MAG: FAD-binding domain [Caulobacteraceae bacterium]|nr:FAD-binding domain [Caulobacteraceae bacterium]
MRIAISGAGVAGPTLAWWLLRAGHQPTLIEAAPVLRTGGYVIDFWGVGYTVAERMGLLPAIHDAGYRVQAARFLDARGREAGAFPIKRLERVIGNRFVSLPRGELAALIHASIDGRVETLFGTTISSIEQADDHVRVGLSNGDVRTFDFVVGADGLHSTVRTLTFGPIERFERRLGYRVAAFDAPGYRPREELAYVTHSEAGRMIARFALRGDRTAILLVFTSDRLTGSIPRELADRKAAIERAFADMRWEWPSIAAALDVAEEVYLDDLSQIVMDRWSSGRVCMIGDAAACVSLLAGEGTGLAMTEAYVLAGELERARGDPVAASKAYEARLRAFIERKQQSARNFAGYFAPRTSLGVWLRNASTHLMGIPFLADAMILGDIRDDFELPDYES